MKVLKLCSSPHLIHPRAARTPYPVAFMDINNNSNRSSGTDSKKDIWMCRKLETLQLGFKPLPKPTSKQSPKTPA
ncbi:hypothetical protein BG015_008872 [Linnemannia schmuckeri]|uniref:Uncharacterized protein n=1 Tax=Linnemannia schmuckeri TaxID=64567 RepID=A0A9P5RWC2_9FUNG|nr:hypothetical protein BG015_008872 [Linnemannia schmuckeri]